MATITRTPTACVSYQQRANDGQELPEGVCSSVPSGDTWDAESRGIRLLLLVIVLIGVISTFVPLTSGRLSVGVAYLPQLLSGLLALVLLFNLRIVSQRKALYQTSKTLADAMSYIGRLEQFSFIDPYTQVFSRVYVDQLFTRQMKWSNRTGTPTTLLLISARDQSTGRSPREIVGETAWMLRSNFRGSDYIIRYSDHRFLVVMPDTSETQAQNALHRLDEKIDTWNLGSKTTELLLTRALMSSKPGEDPWVVLSELEGKLQNQVDNSPFSHRSETGSISAMTN